MQHGLGALDFPKAILDDTDMSFTTTNPVKIVKNHNFGKPAQGIILSKIMVILFLIP